MAPSYAVVWRAPEGSLYVGKVDFGTDRLRFDGVEAGGQFAVEEIFFDALVGVRIARGDAERLQGRPTLIIERRVGSSLPVASAGAPGAMHELIDRLATLIARRATERTRVVASLPLKEGARDEAKALLEQGPPFDPGTTSLERHQVYLTDCEAIFIFEGQAVDEVVEQLLGDSTVWETASSWERLLAGPPRLAEVAYSWVRS